MFSVPALADSVGLLRRLFLLDKVIIVWLGNYLLASLRDRRRGLLVPGDRFFVF